MMSPESTLAPASGISVPSNHEMVDVEKQAAVHATVYTISQDELDPESNTTTSTPSTDQNEKRQVQDAFGDESQVEAGDVKYKTLEWWQAGMIMIAETISLGILSLPSVLATIGMAGALILILGLGALATYSGYVIGQFRNAHPWVHNMADAGAVLFSPLGESWSLFGRYFLGGAQILFLIFAMASHILTWTICINTLIASSSHPSNPCTVLWAFIALILFWLFDLPRTLKNVSHLSIISFISILTAVLITMVDVSIRNPSHGVYSTIHPSDPALSFAPAFLAVTNIVFAYAGHVAFFSFIAELKHPAHFPKALYLLQGTDTVMYFIVALILYRYGGDSVSSPALGSAGPIIRKVAWGVAIPTILIAGVIYGHVAAKMIYVWIYRGTEHMKKRTWRATGSWAGITLVIWTVAFVIAESIPDFNGLLALISALFASWFTYGLSAVFWFWLNWGGRAAGAEGEGEGGRKGWRGWFGSKWKVGLFAVNVLMLGVAVGICFVGLYASGDAIRKRGGGGVWSCKSNAQ